MPWVLWLRARASLASCLFLLLLKQAKRALGGTLARVTDEAGEYSDAKVMPRLFGQRFTAEPERPLGGAVTAPAPAPEPALAAGFARRLHGGYDDEQAVVPPGLI